jgi:hypothetical protein
MVFFARRYPQAFARILRDCDQFDQSNFPFAVTSINMTALTAQLLHSWAFIGPASVAAQAIGVGGSDMAVFHTLYCACIRACICSMKLAHAARQASCFIDSRACGTSLRQRTSWLSHGSAPSLLRTCSERLRSIPASSLTLPRLSLGHNIVRVVMYSTQATHVHA